MIDAENEYSNRFDLYTKHVESVNNKIKSVSNLRLAIFLTFTIAAIFIYRTHNYLFFTIDIMTGIVAFIIAVFWHNELYRKCEALKKLVMINEMGLKRIKGEWDEFKDSGDEFIDHEHPYSWDLDIFGKHSLFQWLCVCHTYFGRQSLARNLRDPELPPATIIEKQNAADELAKQIDWRQKFELNGFSTANGKDPENFLKWSEDGKVFFTRQFAVVFFRLFPYVSMTIGIAGLIFTQTLLYFGIMFAFQLAIFAVFYSKASAMINVFGKNGSLILMYSRLVEAIENQQFSSSYLKALKNNLIYSQDTKASKILNSISRVIDSAEIRFNPLGHLIANTVWLWDLQCVIKADATKKKYGTHFRKWIETIGHFEVASSISIVKFENPDWIFPVINDRQPGITAVRMGHPLLHKSIRIDNDLNLIKGDCVAIVTGSNMSGKSTFLRSVGSNLVLAYNGAPVCATLFRCSQMKIYSSMRIYDDLSSKISTFYAELLRIKKIVSAVHNDETVLFLLDELFRGTNSQDRHDGAVAVLYALSNKKSLGIISTHDMELCRLSEKEPEKFVNFHFEEQYHDNKITFDYKIKNGPSMTRNALFLIKMMGIDTSVDN